LDYSYFYYHIIKKIKILQDIFENKLSYSEIISHFHTSIIDNSKENNAVKTTNATTNKNDTKLTKKENLPTKIEIPKKETEKNNNVNNNDENANIKNNDNNKDEDNNDEENDSDISKLKKIMEKEEVISEDNCIKYKEVENLFYTEMNFYEFVELIFFICRKHYLKKYPNAIFIEMQVPRKEKNKDKQKEKQNIKQKEKETFMEIINSINQEVNEFEKRSKENANKGKFKYKFPELKSHLMKKELIKNIEKMKELERLRAKEIQRYTLERKNLQEEDRNEYIEEVPEEEDDSSEEDF
jgi:hypothetical protein